MNNIKIQKLEEKIAEIKYNIESRWPYEIYGIISKEKLYEEEKWQVAIYLKIIQCS
jgi:hypothetical protein